MADGRSDHHLRFLPLLPVLVMTQLLHAPSVTAAGIRDSQLPSLLLLASTVTADTSTRSSSQHMTTSHDHGGEIPYTPPTPSLHKITKAASTSPPPSEPTTPFEPHPPPSHPPPYHDEMPDPCYEWYTSYMANLSTYQAGSPFSQRSHNDSRVFWLEVTAAYTAYCSEGCDLPHYCPTGHYCPPCSCDPACAAYGDCCPDMMASLEDPLQPHPLRSFLHCSTTIFGSGYREDDVMVTRCPQDADVALTQKCEGGLTSHWNLTRPVTGGESLYTYRNRYCAECHSDTSQLRPWVAEIRVTNPDTVQGVTSSRELYQRVMEDADNFLQYKPPDDVQPFVRSCGSEVPVARCNVTGQWVSYDVMVERACHVLKTPFTLRSITYMNPFCYLCNTWLTWTQALEDSSDQPNPVFGPPDAPLLILLDLSDHDDDDQVDDLESAECSRGHIFHPTTKACTPLVCPPGKLHSDVTNLTCQSSPRETNMYGFEVCVHGERVGEDLASRALWPHLSSLIEEEILQVSSQHESLSRSLVLTSFSIFTFRTAEGRHQLYVLRLLLVDPVVRDVVDDAMVKQLPRFLQALTSILGDVSLRLSPTCSPAVFQGLYSSGGNISGETQPQNGSVTSSEEVKSQGSSSVRPAEEDMPLASSGVRPSEDDMSWDSGGVRPAGGGVSWDYSDRVEDPSWTSSAGHDMVLEWSGHFDVVEPSDLAYVTLIRNVVFLPVARPLVCASLTLDEGHFRYDSASGQLTVVRDDQSVAGVVSPPAFHVTSPRSALVCLQDFQPEDADGDGDTLGDVVLFWLSLASFVVSLVFLLVSFVVYCLLPSLRTVAGLNTMSLVVALFLAQLLLLLGATTPLLEGWVCEVVGALTHYCWLAVVLAQNACTFHMFYTLSFPLLSHAAMADPRLLTKKYTAYVTLTSAALVAVTLGWQWGAEGDSGYGREGGGAGCYIRRAAVRVVMFVTPLTLTVLANLAMFLFTIFRLRRLQQVSHSRSERNSLLLYTKLSVLTGVTWLLGLLHAAVGGDWLAGLYVLSHGCLGLFVFLAFLANARVLAMLREKGREVRGQVTTSTKTTKAYATSRDGREAGQGCPRGLDNCEAEAVKAEEGHSRAADSGR